MTEFRRRHDSGQAFPLSAGGVSAANFTSVAVNDSSRHPALLEELERKARIMRGRKQSILETFEQMRAKNINLPKIRGTGEIQGRDWNRSDGSSAIQYDKIRAFVAPWYVKPGSVHLPEVAVESKIELVYDKHTDKLIPTLHYVLEFNERWLTPSVDNPQIHRRSKYFIIADAKLSEPIDKKKAKLGVERLKKQLDLWMSRHEAAFLNNRGLRRLSTEQDSNAETERYINASNDMKALLEKVYKVPAFTGWEDAR